MAGTWPAIFPKAETEHWNGRHAGFQAAEKCYLVVSSMTWSLTGFLKLFVYSSTKLCNIHVYVYIYSIYIYLYTKNTYIIYMVHLQIPYTQIFRPSVARVCQSFSWLFLSRSTLRSGPITPRQQDLRAQLELPQLQTFLGVNGGVVVVGLLLLLVVVLFFSAFV